MKVDLRRKTSITWFDLNIASSRDSPVVCRDKTIIIHLTMLCRRKAATRPLQEEISIPTYDAVRRPSHVIRKMQSIRKARKCPVSRVSMTELSTCCIISFHGSPLLRWSSIQTKEGQRQEGILFLSGSTTVYNAFEVDSTTHWWSRGQKVLCLHHLEAKISWSPSLLIVSRDSSLPVERL